MRRKQYQYGEMASLPSVYSGTPLFKHYQNQKSNNMCKNTDFLSFFPLCACTPALAPAAPCDSLLSFSRPSVRFLRTAAEGGHGGKGEEAFLPPPPPPCSGRPTSPCSLHTAETEFDVIKATEESWGGGRKGLESLS